MTDNLLRLQEGNRRFVSGECSSGAVADRGFRSELAAGQKPFAIVLGCSDSRVPVEIVFDQSAGDLFVIRVAGNIAAPTQVGSIEYAAVKFGSPLIIVLGHTGCGAVKATLDSLQRPESELSPNLASIVERIRSVVESLPVGDDPVQANIRSVVHTLRNRSEILKRRIESGELTVVGAEYSLHTGAVEFFDW